METNQGMMGQPIKRPDASERLELLTGAIQGTIVNFESLAAQAGQSARAVEFRTYANNLRAIVERWGAGNVAPVIGTAATHGRPGRPTRTPAPAPTSATPPRVATRPAKSKHRVH
jgi:hypothetical protein